MMSISLKLVATSVWPTANEMLPVIFKKYLHGFSDKFLLIK